MSKFQELSQDIGVAVHKATKDAHDWGLTQTKTITDDVLENSNVRYHIGRLVNHTIQNTGDNE